jgi:uncharacterized protein (TIGR02646 family)
VRNLRPRPQLPAATIRRLQDKTALVAGKATAKEKCEEARRLFDQSRTTQWFKEVVSALQALAGGADLCMYCSANESSHVDHYRPLKTFPERSFDYHNFLWACDICNRRYKGDKFPPDTEPGAQILNPVDDNVWDYFFIEETFGQLVPRIDPQTNDYYDRAKSTVEVVGLDREQLRLRRVRRYEELRNRVANALQGINEGHLTLEDARAMVMRWRADPFQADVTDYFLNGPGREKEPFQELLGSIGALA